MPQKYLLNRLFARGGEGGCTCPLLRPRKEGHIDYRHKRREGKNQKKEIYSYLNLELVFF